MQSLLADPLRPGPRFADIAALTDADGRARNWTFHGLTSATG